MTTTIGAVAPTGPTCSVIEVTALAKRFGPTAALRGVDLSVGPAEIVGLLGPSGCGKSTLLACIAGLTEPDGGTVRLAERTVSGPGVFVPPQERGVGLVFQDHALFPHLTVADNVAFGLHRATRSERVARTTEMLDLVRLGHLAGRYPHELSGGESQRVALARSLAPSPVAVLLDEPFASLDPQLRDDLRVDVAAVLRATMVAAVIVTHDHVDALTLADRVVAMREGVVVQDGTPEELVGRPIDHGVARVFGPVTVVRLGHGQSPIGAVPSRLVLSWADGDVAVLRPHQLVLVAPGEGLSGTVRARTFTGAGWRVIVDVGDQRLLDRRATVDIGDDVAPAIGSEVAIALLPALRAR